MKRHDWKFTYTSQQLADGATRKRTHHDERLRWWEKQRDAVMAEIRESGIEVSESQALSHSNTSRGMGPQVLVRNDLQRKLSECHEKIQEHDAKERDYAGWVQVLQADTNRGTYELNHDDWLFFFGE